MDITKINPIYREVMPRGWLGELLLRVYADRDRIWNAYYRACRRIPRHSILFGVTSWEAISKRRSWLIENKTTEDSVEFQALQEVFCARFDGPLTVEIFLRARMLRRLQSRTKK